MIIRDTKKIDTSIEQKKQGYKTPRRTKAGKYNKGNFFAGWEATGEGEFVSPADANGFRIRLKSQEGKITLDGGVSILNTAIPFSGVGGMSIEHDTGAIRIEIGGSGEGLGNRYILLAVGDNSVYFALIDNDDGTYNFKLVGLPTSNPGAGLLWSNAGVVTIGT